MSSTERKCVFHGESERITEVIREGVILVICKPKEGNPHVLDAYGFGLPSFGNIEERENVITSAFNAWMKNNCGN